MGCLYSILFSHFMQYKLQINDTAAWIRLIQSIQPLLRFKIKNLFLWFSDAEPLENKIPNSIWWHTHIHTHSFIYLVVRRSISGRDTYSDAIYDTSRTKKKPVDWQDHVFFSRKRKAASWIKTSSSKLPTNQINQSVLTLSLNFLTIPFAITARSNLNPLIQLLSSSFKRNGKKRTKIRVLDRQFFHVSYTEKCI